MIKETKSDIARKWRRKHKDLPTLKLARMMYKDNPLSFKDIEDARGRLRYIEGKTGKADLKKMGSKTEFVLKEERPRNPYKLPESDETDFSPFVFNGHKRMIILSDIHVPYHSISALTTMFDFCKKEKPDAVLLNGDTIDCHKLSRFIKDPKKRDFKLELDTFKALFDIIEKQFKCKIYFKIGNHEERYEHFLFEKAKELIGVEEFEFENIIKARARGVTMIGDKKIMHANKLNIIHGHEFSKGFFSPVNVARGLALRAKTSAIQGHNHQTSEHPSVDLNGKVMTTWSTGCLCELHPDYLPINNWNHGFAILDLDKNKEDFELRNKKIYRGKIL